MRLARRVAIRGVLPWLTLGVLGGIAPAAPARADDLPAVVVWYRASDECPTGLRFLAKMPGDSVRARLAEAGDHPDFVVTLVASREATVGRLERQTQGGTVAIRELRDVSCERVADALALSLGLALEPRRTPPAPSTEGVAPPAAAPAPNAAEPASAVSAPPPVALEPERSPPSRSAAPVRALTASPIVDNHHISAIAAESRGWSTGVDAGALFGLAPNPLAQATAFAEVAPALSGFASELSMRAALHGALGSTSTAVGPVKQWLLAGSAEVCPVRWGGARFGLRPCVDFELGVAGASEHARESGQHATTLWAAPGVGLRFGAALSPKLTLELEAEALAPLTRSEVDAGSQRLYRADSVVFSTQLGVSVGPF